MKAKLFGLILMPLVLGSCAMLPDSGSGARTKRIVVTVTMEQAINQNFVYIFAFRPSTELNPTTQGPVPVVTSPWGNGFVAGNCTYFVRWDPFQSPRYLVYRFNDANLTSWYQTGVPVNYIDVGTDSKTFVFELDLTQLALTPAEADTYKSLQINLMAMDRIPQGSGGSKAWDALGDGRLPSSINDYITVDLRTTGIYNNTKYGQMEPVGDAPDPSLDIADFQVEVRQQ
jgi:hypothetical protein